MTREEFIFANSKDNMFKKLISSMIIQEAEQFSPCRNISEGLVVNNFSTITDIRTYSIFKEKFEHTPIGQLIINCVEKLVGVNQELHDGLSDHEFEIRMAHKEEDSPDVIDPAIDDALKKESIKITGSNITNAIKSVILKDEKREQDLKEKDDELLNDLGDIKDGSDESDDDDDDEIIVSDDPINVDGDESTEPEELEETSDAYLLPTDINIEENYIDKIAEILIVSEASRADSIDYDVCADQAILTSVILEFSRYAGFIDDNKYNQQLSEIAIAYHQLNNE